VRASLVGNLLSYIGGAVRPRERNHREAAWLRERVGAEAEGTESAEHDRGRERRPSESLFLALSSSLSISISLLSSLSSLDGRVQYFSACTAAGRRARSFDNGIALPGPSVFRAKHRSVRRACLVNVYHEGGCRE